MQDVELQQEDTVSADRKVQIVFDPDAWKKKDKSGRKITSVTSRQNFNNAKYGNRNKQDDDEEEQMKEEKSQIKFVTGNDAIKAGANEVDPKPKTKKIAEAFVKKALKQIAIDKNVGIKDIPFDGPYTKTPADVVDKSGAHHTPYSRVRHLARQAMNKQQVKEETLDEKAAEGFEGTVKAMKKHKEIDNPWALSHWMKKKGYKSHVKEETELTEWSVKHDGVDADHPNAKLFHGKKDVINHLTKYKDSAEKRAKLLKDKGFKNVRIEETVLNPLDPHGDYKEKSKVLHQLSLDKQVDQKEVQQRKLDLDKEYSKLKESNIWKGWSKAYPETKPKDPEKEKQIRVNKDSAILDAIRAKKEKEQKAMGEEVELQEGKKKDPLEIVDHIYSKYKKQSVLPHYDDHEAVKQTVKHHQSKGASAEEISSAVHNTLTKRMNKTGYNLERSKTREAFKQAFKHHLGEEVELEEGKMGQIHADIEDHLGKHLADYKAHGGAEHFGAKTVKTAQHISKLHGIEQKHAQGLVNQYVDSKLKEETEMSDKLTYAQFMEQLLEYTPGPGGVTRVQGRSYGAQYHDPEGDDDADDKPKAEAPKRGRGRPKGSTSGANHKVTSGKKGSGVDYTGFKLHLPNSNR